MKYWRGFLVAFIFAACSWGLVTFAQSHWELVDMVYPYISRLIQNFMAGWSSGVGFCVWQVCILLFAAGILASVVMMLVWKWNFVQWLGWVMAVVSVVVLAGTGLYGLNQYAGPIADDIRLEVADYTVQELEAAAKFYRDEASALADKLERDSGGHLVDMDFEALAKSANEGFETLTYERFYSIFAGSAEPVKELGWSGYFTARGVTDLHVGITGEAAVNPETPTVVLPFAMCRQLAKRRCIANDQDASFAAFLAGSVHSLELFRYSAYFMAYRYCFDALETMNITSAQNAVQRLRQGESKSLSRDLTTYEASFAPASEHAYADTSDPQEGQAQRSSVADLLVSWHLQEYVLPLMEEEEVSFDPMDESQVDLSGIVNAP